jgi:hypothetical protein
MMENVSLFILNYDMNVFKSKENHPAMANSLCMLLLALSAAGSALAQDDAALASTKTLKFPPRFVLQNAGTGKFLTTAFGGTDENISLVQHATRKLSLSVRSSTQALRLASPSGHVIGVPSASEKERCPLTLNAVTDEEAQLWKVIPQPEGLLVLLNLNSGLVMGVKDGVQDDFAQVVQEKYECKPSQQWKVIKTAGATGSPAGMGK